MLTRVNGCADLAGAVIPIKEASFPAPFVSGLEYSSPARGAWNIVHTGMLIPEAHEIFVCAAGCLRGVVLTAAEMHAEHRFSTIEVLEENLLEGNLEELLIDGVTDILGRLPGKPPAVLVYTSCLHHFAGCDLEMVYGVLRERFPDIDFTDCYMNPIMRKSGLTPDQLMRRQLYSLWHPRELAPKTVSVIGNDFPTAADSELRKVCRCAGFKIHEITSCKTYGEYQAMAESSFYITYYPAAKAAGEFLEEKYGGKALHLPFSFSDERIEENLQELSAALGITIPDFSRERAEGQAALKNARKVIGRVPIAIDYTAVPCPLGLARLLLDAGFQVERVYADSFSGEEREDFFYLKEHYPELALYAASHVKMRFAAPGNHPGFLAVGQKAAHFTGTNHFVNIVEGGGLYGFQAVRAICGQMTEAFLTEKDMRTLVQIKGLGCECCV